MDRRYQYYESVPPYQLTEPLEARVKQLGIEHNLQEMREQGYTVLRDVAKPAVTDEIRAAILRLVRETEGRQSGRTAALLLGRDPIFDSAVLNPKLMALCEFMCGQGALLSQLIGSVRPEGTGSLILHADQNWTPAPFPEHNQLMTACWACDDFTEQSGPTKVIPGSHRRRRHPSPAECEACEGAIPILCPRGSIAVWDGSVWHGNYPRALPGERVVLHITYSRVALRPLEDYSHLPQAFLDRNPPEMAALLGRGTAFGSTTAVNGGVDPSLFRRLTLLSKGVYEEAPAAASRERK
jgi:ectoine hydroxylase-related dioxygenase (phytanoyl-CoA dioxygenase family)